MVVNNKDAHARGKWILEKLSQSDLSTSESGVLLNDLLEAMFAGFPVSNVANLANSDNLDAVRGAAWLASELGSEACKIFSEVKFLLQSNDPQVRFCMASCVLLCSNADDGAEVACLILWLEDKDASVRWKALDTILRLRSDQVEAALGWMRLKGVSQNYLDGLALFLDSDRSQIAQHDIRAAIASSSEVLKRLAFLAAVKANFDSTTLRELVSAAGDDDISDFYQDLHV